MECLLLLEVGIGDSMMATTKGLRTSPTSYSPKLASPAHQEFKLQCSRSETVDARSERLHPVVHVQVGSSRFWDLGHFSVPRLKKSRTVSGG